MKISGKFVGKDSAGVGDAKVKIDSGGVSVSDATSDASGVFECAVADSYADSPLKLLVHAAGYQPFEKEIQCSADTDLHDLPLSPVYVAPPPPPPTPPRVAPKPRPWLPLAGGVVLLLACAWGLKSCFFTWHIPADYAGSWVETPPAPPSDGHIVTIRIPAHPGTAATITYNLLYRGPLRIFKFDPKDEQVTMTKSRSGNPSFGWAIGTNRNETKELERINGNTLRLVTTVTSGTPPPPQTFTKQ